ncbi:GspE/PulE family protein [Thermosulfurimonas sp. F29]|uniref:GspE/PulE family protein n=1 Tax=Thermosulfurimonas sp. F29 TaxID=2867247 RepID=UPI001C83EDA7|nr:GspE/PulE family protein [Thermosulfurimonas sp. F29]MBX6424262.1 GspE/PulE family protein [Thermosulfurimonas sp. F29]
MELASEHLLSGEISPVEGLNPALLRTLKVFPFFQNGSFVILIPSMEEITRADIVIKKVGLSGKIYVASEELILELIQKYYEGREESLEIEDYREDEEETHLKDLASEAPVIRLVNRLLREAAEQRATDIHFEPFKDGLTVRFRVDGLLREKEHLPRRLHAPVISRIKLMAGLNIAEHRLPQDGGFRFRVGGKDLDVRVSVIPTLYGEGVVLRLLTRNEKLLNLENLGFEDDSLEIFRDLLSRPNGIILVTGPTGSGKTTTLYAALRYLQRPEVKIITIEDPVEYQIPGLSQIQVKPEIGLTFASALRAILRHDPDIILVGEIRDQETAEIAMQAALTGHLVFSTLHTRDALSAVTRLRDMGIERYLIAASVIGLVAQRLVRKVCPECGKETPPPGPFLKALSEAGLPELPVHYRRGKGCALCYGTGYLGRIAVYEIFPVDDELRDLILENKSPESFYGWARKRGFRRLFEDGLLKAAKGWTTFEEIVRTTKN